VRQERLGVWKSQRYADTRECNSRRH